MYKQPAVHYTNIQRYYSKIAGNQLQVHFPSFLQDSNQAQLVGCIVVLRPR